MPGKWISKDKRHAIYERDNHCCQWCMSPVVVRGFSAADGAVSSAQVACLDHVIPQSLYVGLVGSTQGMNTRGNLVTACNKCNAWRRNLGTTEFSQVVSVQTGESFESILARVMGQLNK